MTIPAFMSWPIPRDMGTPDLSHGQTEAHVWQAGRCGICGGPQSGRARQLVPDHDHETGLLRGMLCTGCNLQEGWQPNILFHRWRSGMNPCAVFGWRYLYRGPGVRLLPISGDEALGLERRAVRRELRIQASLNEPLPELPLTTTGGTK